MGTDNASPTQIAVKLISMHYSPEEVEQIMRRERILFPTIASVLNELLGKKNMRVEEVAGFAGIDPATIYRIMNRQRNPSRNTLIRLALGMNLSFDETQVLLKSGNCSALSGAKKRDLIIIHGIINKMDYSEVNDALEKSGEITLESRG